MVYEKECSECGTLIDFGGEDDGRLPDEAIEFDGNIYCKECVQDLVMFGIGDVLSRISHLEEEVKEIKDQLGIEKHV